MPAIIWAIVWIVGFFTADQVAKHISDTAADKQSLLESTADIAKKLNLTPAQSAALISGVSTSNPSDNLFSLSNIFKAIVLVSGIILIIFLWRRYGHKLKGKK